VEIAKKITFFVLRVMLCIVMNVMSMNDVMHATKFSARIVLKEECFSVIVAIKTAVSTVIILSLVGNVKTVFVKTALMSGLAVKNVVSATVKNAQKIKY
jgi:hypothetical protein